MAAAKAATHVGDANDLNIWTPDGPSYLGFARFPSEYKRSPQLDGIVLDYKTFLGGPLGAAFSPCNDKGDYVADTPDERFPASGWPEDLDTCLAPGSDPIHNYMDYSHDSCYDQFTQGQAERMQNFYAYFRADGGRSVGQ
jgi:hypothetical protein